MSLFEKTKLRSSKNLTAQNQRSLPLAAPTETRFAQTSSGKSCKCLVSESFAYFLKVALRPNSYYGYFLHLTKVFSLFQLILCTIRYMGFFLFYSSKASQSLFIISEIAVGIPSCQFGLSKTSPSKAIYISLGISLFISSSSTSSVQS